MWRIVCTGPSPMDRIRRVVDHGPLHPEEGRAQSIAAFLRSTGLYESVKVVGTVVQSVTVAAPDPPQPATAPAEATDADSALAGAAAAA